MSDRDYLRETMERYLQGCLAMPLPMEEGGGMRPALTISRECGAGLANIEKSLIDYLHQVGEASATGWALFDQGFLGEVLASQRLPVVPDNWRIGESEFSHPGSSSEWLPASSVDWSHFHHIADAIRKLCRWGNAIIVGRGGNFVTADRPNTFHLRMIGSEERRAAAISARERLPADAAVELVRRTDEARQRFVWQNLGAEVGDPKGYHLTINTDHLSDDLIVRLIADSLLEWAHHQDVPIG